MTDIGVPEAEANLSDLLDRVGRGEEIVITRDGRPAARLVPTEAAAQPAGKRATAAELLAIGREFRKLVRGEFSSRDVNAILYDEDGLPK